MAFEGHLKPTGVKKFRIFFLKFQNFRKKFFSKFEFRRYPQWGDEIKHAIQQGNPPVSRSMLQKPNAIVGNLEVRLVGVQVNNSKNKGVTSTFSRCFTSCNILVASWRSLAPSKTFYIKIRKFGFSTNYVD